MLNLHQVRTGMASITSTTWRVRETTKGTRFVNGVEHTHFQHSLSRALQHVSHNVGHVHLQNWERRERHCSNSKIINLKCWGVEWAIVFPVCTLYTFQILQKVYTQSMFGEKEQVFVNFLGSLREKARRQKGQTSGTYSMKISIPQSPKTAIQVSPHMSKSHLLCVDMLATKAVLAEGRSGALLTEKS